METLKPEIIKEMQEVAQLSTIEQKEDLVGLNSNHDNDLWKLEQKTKKPKICRKCRNRNLHKEPAEQSYCDKCWLDSKMVCYDPKKPNKIKTQAEHLKDIMIERGITEICSFNVDIFEEALNRSGSRILGFKYSTVTSIMSSDMAKILFEDAGWAFFPYGVRKHYRVYKLRELPFLVR